MNYYVSTSGLDANPGTIGQPFQTVAKVNSLTLNPGDNVYFKGGETFPGSLTLTRSGSAGTPISFDSYGGGRATINAGDYLGAALSGGGAGDGWGVRITNSSYISVSNLRFVGSGVDSTTGVSTSGSTNGTQSPINNRIGVGIDVVSNTSGSTTNTITYSMPSTMHPIRGFSGSKSYTGFTFFNLEITGFYEGVYVRAEPTSGGQNADGIDSISFDDISIHHCLSFGIYTFGGNSNRRTDGTFQFYNDRVITNLTITDTEIYNVPGDPNNGVASGVMIQMNNVLGGLVERCHVHHGTNLTGLNVTPVGGGGGIIPLRSEYVTVRHCEANNLSTVMPIDACGFDADIDTHFCLFEYNYSHDNYGAGFQSGKSSGLNPDPYYNTFRYNLSVNDGRNPAGNQKIFYDFGMSTTFFHNNTVILTAVSNLVGGGVQPTCIGEVGTATHYSNNIFYTSGGASFIRASGIVGSLVNNLYWNASGTPQWVINGTPKLTLSAFRATSVKAEQAAGSPTGVYSDPLFENLGTGNYNLTARSVAVGRWIDPTDSTKFSYTTAPFSAWPIALPTADYAGTPVPRAVSGRMDIGALQFDGEPLSGGVITLQQVALDTFTATAGVNVDSRAPELGGVPLKTNSGAGSDAKISAAGRVYGAAGSIFEYYYPNSLGATQVEVDLNLLTAPPGGSLPNIQLDRRPDAVTCYAFAYNYTTSGFNIVKYVNNVVIQQTSVVTVAVPLAGMVRVVGAKSVVSGVATLTLSINGTVISTMTDTDPLPEAYAAWEFYPQSTSTTGVHFDNFAAFKSVLTLINLPLRLRTGGQLSGTIKTGGLL